MPGHELIVIGGSAGSLGPLTTVLQGLSPSFPACLLVVVHGSPASPGNLAHVLERTSHLSVSVALDGLPLQRGVFVARPDHHLVVARGEMLVTLGPKENGFRPAIDPLFRTAALAYGSRVIGVILSGALDDGAYGLNQIKSTGGLTIVQDPDDAEVSTMPRNAIAYGNVDYTLPAAAIAPLLWRETRVAPEGDVAMGGSDLADPQLPGGKTDIARMNAELGPPSGLTCPDCGGALWEVADGQLLRFQCHVGHHYSPESFLMQHDGRVEVALWTAVRALEERADLRWRMARQTEAAGLDAVSEAFAEQAQAATEQADQIRDVLTRPGGNVAEAQVEVPAVPRKRPRQR